MCVKEDECYCPCHTNPDIKHINACCHVCPKCGRNILTYMFEVHKNNCKGNMHRVHLTRSY
jgi:hypothetical protein